MSYQTFIDKIIPDGSKLDDHSKRLSNTTDDFNIDTLFVFSIIGFFIYLSLPSAFFAAKKRKEAYLATLGVAITTAIYVLSSFFFWVPLLPQIILLNTLVITFIWVRSIYVFFTEVVPLKRAHDESEANRQKKNFDSIVYKPGQNMNDKDNNDFDK